MLWCVFWNFSLDIILLLLYNQEKIVLIFQPSHITVKCMPMEKVAKLSLCLLVSVFSSIATIHLWIGWRYEHLTPCDLQSTRWVSTILTIVLVGRCITLWQEVRKRQEAYWTRFVRRKPAERNSVGLFFCLFFAFLQTFEYN